eukprot:7984513-Prorocentrum_lima.AAC.1
MLQARDACDIGISIAFELPVRPGAVIIEQVYHPGVYADNHPKISLPDSFSLAVLFRDEYFVIGFIGCLIRITQSCLPDALIKIFEE